MIIRCGSRAVSSVAKRFGREIPLHGLSARYFALTLVLNNAEIRPWTFALSILLIVCSEPRSRECVPLPWNRDSHSGTLPPLTANRRPPRNLAVPHVVPQPPPQSPVADTTLGTVRGCDCQPGIAIKLPNWPVLPFRIGIPLRESARLAR